MGKFADALAPKFADSTEPKLADFRPHTLAWILQRYIETMDSVRPLTESHRCTLRKVCRLPIGKKIAAKITKSEFKDFGKWLHSEGLKGSTANQYFTYMTVALKYAVSDWDECEDCAATLVALDTAKPFLTKHGYIGKSEPRTRRPSPEEIERLVAFFAEANKSSRTKIDMVAITRWQLWSGRRIGESCALLWEDWHREDNTILVRKMKDPKNKNKQKLVALPKKAQAMLEEMWPTRKGARIFPYNKKSCVKRYIEAKKELGIDGLRLHDSRRDCGTRLVEDDGYTSAQAILVTGHETPAIFERVYLRQDPRKFKDGPKGASA